MSASTPLIDRARELARAAHAEQTRKAGDVPYFTHLESVAEILVAHGHDDEVTVAAAYLHDLLEDQPAHAPRLREEMPAEVVATVEALTEKKTDGRGKARDKRARFRDYVAGLKEDTEAARRAIPISCADKIHNTRSLVSAEREGHALLMRLSTRPGQHEAQLTTLRAIYAGRVRPALLASFDEAKNALLDTLAAWLPGWAVTICAQAHLGQFDKAGQPYVYHPLRLVLAADTPEARMAAALHDVVEDSPFWTVERLADEGFPETVLRAIDALSKRDGESYDDFLARVEAEPLATRVKLLDLADNADLSRLASPTDADRARVEKYRRAIARLEAASKRRSLRIALDDASRAALRARAAHPVVRGTHVTLVHRVDPDTFSPAWIPGGAAVGDEVELQVVGEVRDEAVQALSGLLRDVAAIRLDDEPGVSVTASIGLAPMSADFSDVSSWCRFADAALYAAKHNGRNRLSVAQGSTMSQLVFGRAAAANGPGGIALS